MDRIGIKYILLVLMMITGMVCWGGIHIPKTGRDTCSIAMGDSLWVYTPGGPDSTYENYCEGGLLIEGVIGGYIQIRCRYEFESHFDYIQIYRGGDDSGIMIEEIYDVDSNVYIFCDTNVIYLRFHSDVSGRRKGAEMLMTMCYMNENIVNVRDSLLSDNRVRIDWDDVGGASRWRMKYGVGGGKLEHEVVLDSSVVVLEGLHGGKSYDLRIYDAMDSLDCGSRLYHFSIPCEDVDLCRDFTDIYACDVRGYYGVFSNANQDTGIVDFGSLSSLSRHTVHRDTSERDIRTWNGLRTIPKGELSSVRLGNWETGAQAESIIYKYVVDTSVYDMLVMQYAAVLEDPSHPLEDQPRFKFSLLDDSMRAINSACYSADYIANSNLGWNTCEWSILWKDWTPVGVDLNPLHGQTIYIQLTTYDCNYSAHYGYAYFTLRCANKIIKATNCGNTVANTFMAPEGYTYKWYKADNPDSILGTARSLDVTEAGVYKCKMLMIGVSSTDCELEMTAVAGYRYPYARFGAEEVGEPCEYMVQFREQSVVTGDEAHTVLSDEACDGVWWDFGDGEVSTERNPRHRYDTLGDYSVRMVASLSNGQCSDTITKVVQVGYGCPRTEYSKDMICEGDRLVFYDTVLTTTGRYKHLDGVVTKVKDLRVIAPKVVHHSDTIVENSLPWSFGGREYGDDVENDTLHYRAVSGCDSMVVYELKVYRNVHEEVDSVLCENSLPLVWNGVTFSDSGSDSTVFDSVSVHGVDSVVHMRVEVLRNSEAERRDTVVENGLPVRYVGYSFDTVVEDSTLIIPNGVGCDSVINYGLWVHYNVDTMLRKELCADVLPYRWYDKVFDSAGVQSLNLVNRYGADSTVWLSLVVHPVYSMEVWDSVCVDDVYRFGSQECCQTGVYDEVFRTVDGCDSAVRLHLELDLKPHAVEHLNLCEGGTLTWRDGVTYESPTNTPLVEVAVDGECDSVIHLDLTTHRLLARANVSPKRVTENESELTLIDGSIGNVDRVWYLPDRSSTAVTLKYDYPLEEDSIKVELFVTDEFGCEDSTSVMVRQNRGQIWVPNVFTPDEIENNVFRVVYKDVVKMDVVIFDRNGEMMYRYDALEGGWNGMKGGKKCPQASYVYYIKYCTKMEPDNVKTVTGSVLLLR